MMITHVLGFPRIHHNRELKFAVESFWKNEISETELHLRGKKIREGNWQIQSDAGIAMLPVNDFSWYDHVLDMSVMLGVIPERFGNTKGKVDLSTYFQMARGSDNAHACEITKWFDTNYHYVVPELAIDQTFNLDTSKLLNEIDEAHSLGYRVKPVLLGPLTYLWLSKTGSDEFNKLTLLPQLLICYRQLFSALREKKIEWVQIDEPILILDLPFEWSHAFRAAYQAIQDEKINILLTTYFGSVEHHIDLISQLGVAGIHLDYVSAPEQIDVMMRRLTKDQILSVGIVNGRNIWRTDLTKTVASLRRLHEFLGDRLWLSSSCSLLHVPVDLDNETTMDKDLKQWFAFARQKLQEIHFLAKVFDPGENPIKERLEENQKAIQSRLISKRIHNPEVKQRCSAITPDLMQRKNSYSERRISQDKVLHLPLLPTTTIGSFPQTKEIRELRQSLANHEISESEYEDKIKQHIKEVVMFQDQIGLDVLVHGEAERNDMVEYFAAHLNGFALTQNGWVQSYGTRCVKPPIIYGDVNRPSPITIEWIRYAQSCTTKPVKGMLTGPVTLVAWSFVRDDQTRFDTARQIALTLRDEVKDLENAGVRVIQIDEPAYREGLPLRKKDWQAYLIQAVACFKLASAGVQDETQIHTHMCYSEFNDIIDAIADLDADVISIETSRSQMELLNAFKQYEYPNSIGPGIYDIHSPRVPSVKEMLELIRQASNYIAVEKLWINPDCGLKTRQWPETEAALKNMVEAARTFREEYLKKRGS